MKKPPLIAAVLVLGGCAATYTEPSIPADHPANAAALESGPMSRSRTLDLTAAEPVGAARADAPMGHAGHGVGGAPKPDSPPTPATDAAAWFACPMHHEVTSDQPDQRCPKCGMKLKKQDGGKQP